MKLKILFLMIITICNFTFAENQKSQTAEKPQKKEISTQEIDYSKLDYSKIYRVPPDVKAAEKSVVAITVTAPYRDSYQVYYGSGVVVEKNLVLTMPHVISEIPQMLDQMDIKIKINNQAKPAKVLFYSYSAELILLEVDTENLPPIKIASVQNPDEFVWIFGRVNFEGEILIGPIPQGEIKLAPDEPIKQYQILVHNITRGTSGGAVLNNYGELVGMPIKTDYTNNLSLVQHFSVIRSFLKAYNDNKAKITKP